MNNLREFESVEKKFIECYSKHLQKNYSLSSKVNFSSCIDKFTSNIRNSIVRDHSNIMKNYFINNSNENDHNMILNNIPEHE